MKTIKTLDLKGKRVFLRSDLNIPISSKETLNVDEKILQDYKLEKIIPTIDYIIKNGGKVILATHIGRPKAEGHTNFFDIDLTTKILVPWFEKRGYKICYEIDLEKAITLSKQNFGEILLLENLRFFNGEKGSPQEREKFAKILRDTADVYVNDAFALSHRDDTSVTLLPQKFEQKSVGLLTEKEISQLNKIKTNPKQPFVFILGGNKIKTKIPLLKNLIEKENDRPSSIIIGGAIADVFLDTKNPSKTKYNKEDIEFAKSFLEKAKENNIKILLPIDKLELDIGPETIKLFCKEITKAKTIFVNGTMGVYQKKDSQTGTKEVLKSIANSNAYTVAGGGDCVAAIHMFDLQDKFNFLSTGGGATLAFLGS